MGTITSLIDRIARARGRPDPCPVLVTAFGFALGEHAVAWQTVSEIWGYKMDRITTDEGFLEFVAGDKRIAVSEELPGFSAFEKAMIAVFPSTAQWRGDVLQPPFAPNLTLLYRRG